MAKWYGKIGFYDTEETSPGVWEPTIIEKSYYGEVIQFSRKYVSSDRVNDNISIVNRISILSDSYANNNISNIAYVEVMGIKWKISDIDLQFPRLLLTFGGIYNDQD